MQLECVFFGPFRDAVGRTTVYHETDADTSGDLLRELESSYPALEGELAADDVDEPAPSGRTGDTVVTKNKRNGSTSMDSRRRSRTAT